MKPFPISRRGATGACLLMAACPLAFGQLISSIGTQHFADGDVIGTGTYITAVSGQPTPFGQFIGSDASGGNFSADWTLNYTPPVSFNTASLTFGIFDHDSTASSTPVTLFSVAGVDLTSSLNTIMTAHGGANGEYNIYTINLPSSTYSAILGGAVEFHLGLNGPGIGVLGPTTFNGAGLDFINLYVAVPEPATEAWFGAAAALSLLGVHLHRRRSAR